MSAKRQIFVDVDGVLADLDRFYLELTGLESPKLGGPQSKEFWRNVNRYTKSGRNFYEDLPLLPDAYELWEGVKKFHPDPIMLTGGGDPDHYETTEGKGRWRDKYFPGAKMIVCKSREKCLYGKPGDILIDDWTKWQHLWEGMGGIFIVHYDAKDTLFCLDTLYKWEAKDRLGEDDATPNVSEEAHSDSTAFGPIKD